MLLFSQLKGEEKNTGVFHVGEDQVFSSPILLLKKKERKKLLVGIKVRLRFSSYQTVGVDLLGLNFLVCCDLLDVLLRFL